MTLRLKYGIMKTYSMQAFVVDCPCLSVTFSKTDNFKCDFDQIYHVMFDQEMVR